MLSHRVCWDGDQDASCASLPPSPKQTQALNSCVALGAAICPFLEPKAQITAVLALQAACTQNMSPALPQSLHTPFGYNPSH